MAIDKQPPKNHAWTPAAELDLATASSPAFEECVDRFKQWVREQRPLGPLSIKTGWHTVTPEMAEEFLCRTAPNRRLSLMTIKKYARVMQREDWRPTGQPIIFDKDGKLQDAQHRLWACYLGRKSFPSFIVADAPVHEHMFAYLDDCKPRSASDAIRASGNGRRATKIGGS
jgi:hypothetical protein